MRFKFISDHRETFRVGLMCKVLEVAASAFYAWLKRPESNRSKENRRLESKIRLIHAESNNIYGSPKIHDALKCQGETCGVTRVAGIMKKAGIKSRTKKKCKTTTNSHHKYPVAPNLLNQNFKASSPNSIWVADITYIWTSEGWLYLATLMDLFSRRIVGWSMSNRMTQTLTIDALKMAISKRKDVNGLIHHSDRGSQYAATAYQKILNDNGILCSMSRKGSCYDNAVMESFFHSLKSEWVYHYRYFTRQQAKTSIFEYIEIFYNRQRSHSYLNYMSPHNFEVYKMAA